MLAILLLLPKMKFVLLLLLCPRCSSYYCRLPPRMWFLLLSLKTKMAFLLLPMMKLALLPPLLLLLPMTKMALLLLLP